MIILSNSYVSSKLFIGDKIIRWWQVKQSSTQKYVCKFQREMLHWGISFHRCWNYWEVVHQDKSLYKLCCLELNLACILCNCSQYYRSKTHNFHHIVHMFLLWFRGIFQGNTHTYNCHLPDIAMSQYTRCNLMKLALYIFYMFNGKANML